MPDEIEQLVADGLLELSSHDGDLREYLIPALRHRQRTGMGWQILIYCLLIDDNPDPDGRYTIEQQSEYSGNDTILITDDPDEIDAWIRENVAEAAA